MTVLTLCWTFVWPFCTSVQYFNYPTYQECDKERAALMAMRKPPSRATCTPHKPEDTPR
jgi:hypothetical protein